MDRKPVKFSLCVREIFARFRYKPTALPPGLTGSRLAQKVLTHPLWSRKHVPSGTCFLEHVSSRLPLSINFSHHPCLNFTGMARPSVAMPCCDYSVRYSIFPLLCPFPCVTLHDPISILYTSYLLALCRLLSNSNYFCISVSALVPQESLVLRFAPWP